MRQRAGCSRIRTYPRQDHDGSTRTRPYTPRCRSLERRRPAPAPPHRRLPSIPGAKCRRRQRDGTDPRVPPLTVDILYLSYNRAPYVRETLPRLLEQCGAHARVWIWQNGSDPETLEAVRPYEHHPRVGAFVHSPENQRLRGPTNWLWSKSRADLLGKMDDDGICDEGWIERLREAHRRVDRLGIVATWRFHPDDDVPSLIARKVACIDRTPPALQLFRNPWVAGSGYLMKRVCVERLGLLPERGTFTDYCIRVARSGWLVGYLHPFVRQQHLDDPRFPASLIRTDEDLRRYMPLTAANDGTPSRQAWIDLLRDDARAVQTAPVSAHWYAGPLSWPRRAMRRARRLFR